MKLSVIIPAHNEEDTITTTIEALVKELKKENIDYEMLCINDNSTDKTLQLLQEFADKDPSIKVINRKFSPGFGRAIKDGLNYVKGDAVVFVMADMSDDPKDVVRYFRKIEEGYDCVFGSRFIRGSKVIDYPFIKLLLNRLANNFIRLLFFMKFNDVTNAFKMYRTNVVKACMPLLALHFNITVEIPLKAYIRGFKIAQIPINWYGRKSSISKFKIKEITRKYLFTVFYVWLENILLKDELRQNER